MESTSNDCRRAGVKEARCGTEGVAAQYTPVPAPGLTLWLVSSSGTQPLPERPSYPTRGPVARTDSGTVTQPLPAPRPNSTIQQRPSGSRPSSHTPCVSSTKCVINKLLYYAMQCAVLCHMTDTLVYYAMLCFPTCYAI